jgi:hypothetical protein
MKPILAVLLVLALAGCATRPPGPDLSAFRTVAPRSILIVPIVNKTLEVEAPNYMLTTLPIPIAEKGYYVFPVNTVKVVLEHEGLYEPERVRAVEPSKLADLFGADAILYVSINRWDAQYVVLTTVVTVELDYKLVAKTGQTLWTATKKMQYSPQNTSTGSVIADLVVAAVNAAITRAAPNYIPLARQANYLVLVAESTAWPDGPYRLAK